MRLRPTPTPKGPLLTTPDQLTKAMEALLIEVGTYSNPSNRRAAAENLTWAVLRVIRGADRHLSSETLVTNLRADAARRRLQRAARLFCELADRLED